MAGQRRQATWSAVGLSASPLVGAPETQSLHWRVMHRFHDLAVISRCLKIHQPHADTSYSFALADPRADITIEFDRRRPKR